MEVLIKKVFYQIKLLGELITIKTKQLLKIIIIEELIKIIRNHLILRKLIILRILQVLKLPSSIFSLSFPFN